MLLNEPLDISAEFFQWQHELFVADRLDDFDPASGTGSLQWRFHKWVTDRAFNTGGMHLKKLDQREEFWRENEVVLSRDLSISFIDDRTIRLRLKTRKADDRKENSLILDGQPPASTAWRLSSDEDIAVYSGAVGHVKIHCNPWKLEICDKDGKVLTSSLALDWLNQPHPKSLPFCIVKKTSDDACNIAASFQASPGEKIAGGGESFTAMNKSGQKLVLCATDAQNTASGKMYKPVPFFVSSRGYGMFVHTAAPVTFDLGHTHRGTHTFYLADDELDLFVFLGSPKEILYAYTGLTGRSPLPPLWSFGLWMSRLSYRSAQEVTTVAAKLREQRIPCDVIHIDAGWFRDGVNCDFEFDPDRFPDPEKMIKELKKDGFRVSLWQLPYFTSSNRLAEELRRKKLCIKNDQGQAPPDDLVLDFTQPAAVDWYRNKITRLLQLGVSAIKADFGEAAPLKGLYHSGKTGLYEHNIYPLRYNQLLHDLTREINGESIIWARSAWAGSQRYPLHWGGDPEVTDYGMAGSLAGGLSLGLSGFSFWSHDIGGFFAPPSENLFLRWAFFGLLSSHSRVHGFPPREPWEFSRHFLNSFRSLVEMRYRLMPYIYSQAALSSEKGLPLLRALLLEYPEDPVSWMIEDQYLLGSDLLVAPLFEESTGRRVYFPEGNWINYFTRETTTGNSWSYVDCGEIPGALFARHGSLIPHIPLLSCTTGMDWNTISLQVFGNVAASCFFHDPLTKKTSRLDAEEKDGVWKLKNTTDNNNRFTLATDHD